MKEVIPAGKIRRESVKSKRNRETGKAVNTELSAI